MRFLFFIALCWAGYPAFAQQSEKLLEETREHIRAENYPAALASINRAISLDESNPELYLERGYIFSNTKENIVAYQNYSKAMELAPENHQYAAIRATFLLANAEFALAHQDINLALSLAGKTDTVYYHYLSKRGLILMFLREFDQAYLDFRETLAFLPDDIVSLTNLSTLYSRMGNHEEAIKHLKIAHRIYPDHTAVVGNLGFQYQKAGKYEESIAYYNRVLELEPDEPLAYSNRSYSKLRLDDYDGAMADINKSILLFPENSYAFRNRALIYLEKGDIISACNDLETALRLGFTEIHGDEVLDLLHEICK